MLADNEEIMATTDLKTTFRSFREQCVWLQTCFNTFEVLYSSGSRVERLLNETALVFFGDLNAILQEYVLLQICKLTDRAESYVPTVKHKVPNLTVEHLNALLKVEGLLTPEIEAAASGLAHYRTFVEPSRNKLISHLDKTTVLGSNVFGAHSKKEVSSFFENLQRYCDSVGEAVLEGPLDFRTTSGPGDVRDLLRHLNNGKYLHD